MSYRSKGSLHVGSRRTMHLGRMSRVFSILSSLTRADVAISHGRTITDECGEDLKDVVMVNRGVMHQPAESLNAANPHIKLCCTELLQSLCKSFGDLPAMRQAIGTRSVE